MNMKKKLYETPQSEEMIIDMVGVIALSMDGDADPDSGGDAPARTFIPGEMYTE